jgi:hypothetical protein
MKMVSAINKKIKFIIILMATWVNLFGKNYASIPKPIKTFSFSTGIVIHNWNWKYREVRQRGVGYNMGWDLWSKGYSIMNIDKIKPNLGLSGLCSYELAFRRFNLNFGLRTAGYAFHQRVNLMVSQNYKIVSQGPAEIRFMRYGIAPVVGIGGNFKISNNLSYQPSIKVLHNMTYTELSYQDVRNEVIIYDSGNNQIGKCFIPWGEGYNHFSFDDLEYNLCNSLSYRINEKTSVLFAADFWIGSYWGWGYTNNFRYANYKYIGLNLGLKYRL